MSLGAHPGRVDWSLAVSELVPHFQPFADEELARWERSRPEAVAPFSAAVTEKIYRVLPEEVRPFLNPPLSEWPFRKGIRKGDWMLPEVEDLTGGLPLALCLHRYVEHHGSIPSWREAAAWFSRPDQAAVFLKPAWDRYNSTPEERRVSRDRWQRAINWRIGNAYLSFLREMDFLARMVHDHGIPLRTHILADAVLKIDFWVGRHAICVFIPNDKFDRKISPSPSTGEVHLLQIGDGSMWTEVNGVKRKLEWNEIKQAPEAELRRVAEAIKADMPSTVRKPASSGAAAKPSWTPSALIRRPPPAIRPQSGTVSTS